MDCKLGNMRKIHNEETCSRKEEQIFVVEISSSWGKLAAYALNDRDSAQKKSHIKVMALQYIVMLKSTKETEKSENIQRLNAAKSMLTGKITFKSMFV